MEPTALVPILDGVWRWSVWNAPRSLWFNGHLLRVGDQALLVDPVPMNDSVQAALATTAAWARTWLCAITNRDHERAARHARERFGCRLLVTRADAPQLELPADELIDDGDLVAGELRAVRVAAAKTPGELALHWPARRLLVLGDAAVGRPAGTLSMLPDDKFADITAARAGVAQLAALDPDIVLVGDGDDILANGRAALGSLGAAPRVSIPGSGARPGC